MAPDWLVPAFFGCLTVAAFAYYALREEAASRRRYPDERHEHGPFGP